MLRTTQRGGMNTNTVRWQFQLVDEKPGPSIDDAADFIRQHGGDPWKLDSLDRIANTTFGNIVISEFAATGPASMLNQIRSTHAQASGSTPEPNREVYGGDQCFAGLKE